MEVLFSLKKPVLKIFFTISQTTYGCGCFKSWTFLITCLAPDLFPPLPIKKKNSDHLLDHLWLWVFWKLKFSKAHTGLPKNFFIVTWTNPGSHWTQVYAQSLCPDAPGGWISHVFSQIRPKTSTFTLLLANKGAQKFFFTIEYAKFGHFSTNANFFFRHHF